MVRISRFPGTKFMTRQTPYGFGTRFSVADDQSVFATIVFDESKEGGHGILHGGAIAAVLDEAMGTAAFESGYPGYTVTMTCNYAAHIPLGEEILIKARVDKVEAARKVFASCEAILPDGTVAVDGSGIFISLEPFQQYIHANLYTPPDDES